MAIPKINWTEKEKVFLRALHGDVSVHHAIVPNHPGKAVSQFQERGLPFHWPHKLVGAFANTAGEENLPIVLSTETPEWPWTPSALEAV